MRAFACYHCGQLLFFENSHCLRCGATLGFVPELLELRSLEPDARERHPRSHDARDKARRDDGPRRPPARRCARAHLASCNWLVSGDDPNPLCRSCRLTASIPELQDDRELRAVAQAEAAKRRLLYQLLDLRLPLATREQDPNRGLMFVFGFGSERRPVSTGHSNGIVTLDLAECDHVHRERVRHQFGEPYRTLLGHFRHEIGHYYWGLLVARPRLRTRFRELFGDERNDYREALQRNYEGHARRDWSDYHVSAYAASHPWEDWAETFAHYLHIRDTLQTAASFGLHVSPRAQAIPPHGGKLSTRAREEIAELDFAQVVCEWLPLTYAFNAVNRSMGKEDVYPFVLAPAVIEKLSFVHDVVRDANLEDVESRDSEVEVREEPDSEARAAEGAEDSAADGRVSTASAA